MVALFGRGLVHSQFLPIKYIKIRVKDLAKLLGKLVRNCVLVCILCCGISLYVFFHYTSSALAIRLHHYHVFCFFWFLIHLQLAANIRTISGIMGGESQRGSNLADFGDR